MLFRYRLSSLLATNRPGNHALTRIKDALSENEEAITNLTNKFTAYKFDTQQDLAQKTMTKFFRGVVSMVVFCFCSVKNSFFNLYFLGSFCVGGGVVLCRVNVPKPMPF